jgi:hypothetical protein
MYLQLTPILAILASISILISTVELIRRTQLRTQHALVWWFGSVVVLVVAVFWNHICPLLGLPEESDSPWWLLVVAGFFLAFAVQVSHTIAISKSTENVRDMAQRIALVEWYLRELQRRVHEMDGASSEQLDDMSVVDLSSLKIQRQPAGNPVDEETG